MHLKLASLGYDVYIGSNRGTEYCQKHNKYTPDQREYWAWSFAEMGLYDDVANIKMIKKKSGHEKIFYLGWSQGTIQMFYALAHLEDEFLADSLHRFVALAPCTIAPKDGLESYWYGTLYALPSVGVYDFYGPNWDSELQTICDELGQEACDYATCYDCFPMSVQSETHWYQNTYTDRFQEWNPDYLKGKDFRESKLVPIDTINKVPITMMAGTLDDSCSYEQAQKTAKIIGDKIVDFVTMQDWYHGDFGQANDDDFMDKLTSKL